MLDELENCGISESATEMRCKLPTPERLFRPRPFAGWALVSSCRLAAAFPSLLSHAVQCSPLKRQSLFACFAEIDWSRPDSMGDRLSHVAPADASAREPLLLIARSVVATRAAAVLEAVFGSVPDGLLGVMKRLGDQPFTHPGLYRLLHELMGNPIHRARAKVLTQISGLNATTIQIVRDLDHPGSGLKSWCASVRAKSFRSSWMLSP